MNSYPIIAWRNLMIEQDGRTVTASSEADGYPIENLADWRDYTRWRCEGTGTQSVKLDAGEGEEITVDCMAIAGHNLADAEVEDLVLSYSDNDSDYTPCFSALTPDDGRVIFRKFDARTARFFKLIIPSGYSTSVAPEIGVLFVGEAMEIPGYPGPGFDPDIIESDEEANISRTGRLLGVCERYRTRSIKAVFSRLSRTFILDIWMTFFKEHASKPFFFAWDPDESPDQTYLARLSPTRTEAPYQQTFRELSLEMESTEKT